MNDKYGIELYQHNLETIKKIEEAFEETNIASILHATGTGKAYLSLALANNKKTLFIEPKLSIIEHIKEIIDNLEDKSGFEDIEFITYQELALKSDEEIEEMNDYDLIIVDEMHHIGAPIWGPKTEKLLEENEYAKILGTSAYAVRDRGTINESDITDPDYDGIFADTVVSKFDLAEAMLTKVVPTPIYKSTYSIVSLGNVSKKIEQNLKDVTDLEEKKNIEEELKRVNLLIHKAPQTKELVRNSIKPNGKYIYFCPPNPDNTKNNIELIMKEAREWFNDYNDDEIEFYMTTSKDELNGKRNRDSFYNDTTINGLDASNKLRIMFAINQYNEGVHVPNIDGVILGRGTSSDIVYFEQIGRALSARGDSCKNYQNYIKKDINELKEIATLHNIEYDENISKESLINKLISPLIIDLVNNIDFFKELNDELKNRKKEIYERKESLDITNRVIDDVEIDFDITNRDIHKILMELNARTQRASFDTYYNLLCNFKNKYKTVYLPYNFKTIDGISKDDNGYALGIWFYRQLDLLSDNKLNESEVQKLKLLSVVKEQMSTEDIRWLIHYECLKNFVGYHKNYNIPYNFKTFDGITFDDSGYNLGTWLSTQKKLLGKNKLSKEKKEKLEAIGIKYISQEEQWEIMYNLLVKYIEYYGHANVPYEFQTLDGINEYQQGENTNGLEVYNLGKWLSKQKQLLGKNKLAKERQEKLEAIGIKYISSEEKWEIMYNLLVKYIEHYGHANVPAKFKTLDGINEYQQGEIINGLEVYNLGAWLDTQKQAIRKNKLAKERQEKLETIGIKYISLEEQWEIMYNLLVNYIEHYGHANVPQSFKTIDGINEYKKGENTNGLEVYNLGAWLSRQKQLLGKNKLVKEGQEKLEAIGIKYISLEEQWEIMYNLLVKYIEYYGHANVPDKFQTLDGINEYQQGENTNGLEVYNLGKWLSRQKQLLGKNKLVKEGQEKLEAIGIKHISLEEQWEIMYNLLVKYIEYYGHANVPNRFQTLDGINAYDHDENKNGLEVYNLGIWLNTQKQAIKKNKLSKERKEKLEKIGVIIDVKINTELVKDVCEKYNIIYDKSLKNISHQELEYKIKYLLDNDKEIMVDKEFNPFIFISRINMEVLYNISYEELKKLYGDEGEKKI